MRFSLLLRTGCLGVIACTMTGCIAPLVVGGAAITTATVVTDRRSPGSIVSDEVLEKRVSYEIAKSLGEVDSHITVTSYSGRVLLTGEVPNAQIQARVRQVAAGSLDVVAVVDELAVMPVSSMSSRLSDSLLATKVRTALIGNGKVSLNQMKVVSERGIVYLMGIVTKDESQEAVRTVVGVPGVQKVVSCFEVESAAEIAERMKEIRPVGQSEVR